MDAITQKNIKKWREMVNTGKSMAPSDLVKAERATSSPKRDHEEDPDSQSEKKQKSKKGKKQRRLTNVAASGLKDDTVEVKLDSEDEQYSASNRLTREVGVSFPRYDSMIQVKPGPSIQDSEEVPFMKKVRRFKSLGISKGRTCKPTYAVIDSGADQDHVGNGWRIVHISRSMETLVGALDGMGSVSLHKVDAICAVMTSKNNVQLIGIGGATWDGRPSQHESLFNSHHLRSNKVQVNDVAKVHGGSQDIRIEIDGKITILPLDLMTTR
jgi:hypothetical protein